MSVREDVPAVPVAQTPSIRNLANLLTLLRLLLVPVFVALFVAHGGHSTGWRVAAALVFAAASLTDRVDGYLARSRGAVTDLGAVVDPLADKALTGAALITLSALGDLPWWVTAVILGREFGVTALRFWVIRHGVIPSTRGAKWKTALQGVAIGLFVLPLSGADDVRWGFMAAAILVTLATGGDYVARALALRRARTP